MTVRLAILIASVAVLSGHGFAQDPYQQILRSLEAGKEGDAAIQLLRVIRAGPSDARTVLLDQCYTSFRQRGTSAAWLRCLGQALEAAPDDVEFARTPASNSSFSQEPVTISKPHPRRRRGTPESDKEGAGSRPSLLITGRPPDSSLA